MMTRFNQPITTTHVKTSESLPDQKPLNKAAGFTLIELLFAAAIIAVLIALLLPVIQRKREMYAQAKAAENLIALLVASNEYFARTGHYPHTLADLRGFSGAPTQSGTFNLLVTTGKAEGYLYDYNGDGAVDGADFLVVAEPEFPGITGTLTLTINANGIITSAPTPGADAARARMFQNIRAKAAETAVKLLNLNPNAYSQVRSYTESPATITDVLRGLDGNDDVKVSIAEIQFANTTFDDQALSNPLQGFLDYVAQEMKWESLSADAQALISINFEEIINSESQEPSLFSYDGLCRLTGFYSYTVGPNITDLCANLETAEAAEKRGDLQGKASAINAYQTGVKAQIGQSLTRNNANILIALSKTL